MSKAILFIEKISYGAFVIGSWLAIIGIITWFICKGVE